MIKNYTKVSIILNVENKCENFKSILVSSRKEGFEMTSLFPPQLKELEQRLENYGPLSQCLVFVSKVSRTRIPSLSSILSRVYVQYKTASTLQQQS